MKQYYVYILWSSRENFYVWVTLDLVKRVYQHKEKIIKWFTEKYNINKLLYYEIHNSIDEAIKREKLWKKRKREWKKNIITDMNPTWKDLYNEITT